MKLTVAGFKSISRVDDFDFRPLTLLAGINSSGKSSLIQALLLLKQSFEANGNEVLTIHGDYVNANEPLDLTHGKDRKRRLHYVLKLEAEEMANSEAFAIYLPEGEPLKRLDIILQFTLNGSVHLEDLQLDMWYGEEGRKKMFQLCSPNNKSTFNVTDIHAPMANDSGVKNKARTTGFTPTFKHGFLPFFGERKDEVISFPIIKDVSDTLASLFEKINYIGPQRVKPDLARSYDRLDFANVGINGENTRFLLNEKKNYLIEGYDKTLTELVNLWIVERMKLAQEINVSRDANKLYRVTVKNESGVKVDLCQTGFGLSQLLPIVTQGLLTPKGGTLIVEDPDVHMHPRVQAEIVNFFADLIAHGRKVIVETHSDHIVTRTRLLLAQNSTLHNDDVNVCFVTNDFGHSEYKSCTLTEEGMFTNPLPTGFMDTQEQDFRDIIKSQLQAKKNGMAGSI